MLLVILLVVDMLANIMSICPTLLLNGGRGTDGRICTGYTQQSTYIGNPTDR